jgi:aryl-alcohol dehydrogenase-like predicted oxidoreductase
MESKQKLSEVLPPLIFGTATFNYQFNPDPYALGPTAIVQKAFAHGVRAWDTSPYYGPAEDILGDAFSTPLVRDNYPREQYHILTKVGRVAADTFDYSPEWIRHSVTRSCQRLRTSYLDVVYCHDAEFVTPAEVLTAVRELRRIRDADGIVKYVGICGYPVDVLCDLAEMILAETGEPLDIVQSYANFTIQNQRLLSRGLARLIAAGVDIVTNGSPLGMGLLRKQGPPIGSMGDFHPAPTALRNACYDASTWLEGRGEKLEVVAVRFALENWLREGAAVGARGNPLPDEVAQIASGSRRSRLGVNVMGVSKIEELDETMKVWRSILYGLRDHTEAVGVATPSQAANDNAGSLQRRQQIHEYAGQIRAMLGGWKDHAWDSPGSDFVRKQIVKANGEDANETGARTAAILTPPPESEILKDFSKHADISSFNSYWSQHGTAA